MASLSRQYPNSSTFGESSIRQTMNCWQYLRTCGERGINGRICCGCLVEKGRMHGRQECLQWGVSGYAPLHIGVVVHVPADWEGAGQHSPSGDTAADREDTKYERI